MADEYKMPFTQRAYIHYNEATKNVSHVSESQEEKDLEEIEEYRAPLSIEERKEVTILLSWGGPSDGYKIYFDTSGEAFEGFYFFADWFEYEEFKLTSDELDKVVALYCY